MSAKVAERALEPKDVGKDTGLGLSQVYGKLHQSGGAARIESALGIETTVRLYLRRTDRGAVARFRNRARHYLPIPTLGGLDSYVLHMF
jgi:hypothetical protein